MNNKRQTIWLVSMLSLMVILSAYYLFTEDVSPNQNAGLETEQTQTEDPAGAGNPEGVSVTEVDSPGQSGSDAEGEEAAPTGEGDGIAPEDQEVLQRMGNEEFDRIKLMRKESLDEQMERLDTIIADSSKPQEEAALAIEESNRLEDIDARITRLEEKLLVDYDNAVVSEEENQSYRIIVQTEKLDKKGAVGIVDLAVGELNVSPAQLTVEYVGPQ